MKKYDVIVIGAGFGGLASALTLQSSGLSVGLVEALDKPGGRAYAEVKNGYCFDRGPSIITAPFLIDDVFRLSGVDRTQDCTFVPLDPYYKVVFDDESSLSHFNEYEKLIQEIAKISPDDVNGVSAFFEHTNKNLQTGFIDLGGKLFPNILSLLKVAPQLLKLNAIRSVYSMVSQYVKHEKIRQFLSFHPLLVGGNPFSTPAIYSLINSLERAYGVFHPIGGMNAVVSAFVKRFQELGGELFLSQKIDCIDKDINGDFLVSSADQTFCAKKIIINTDMYYALTNVLKEKVRPKKLLKTLERADYSMSAFLLYLGTKRQWPHMSQHTIVLTSRYEGLLKDIFVNKVESDDFSFYIHMPTRTDSSLAPAGGEVIYALVPVPNLASGTDWNQYQIEFSNKVKNVLEKRFLPGLQDSIVEESIFGPQDFKNTLLSHLGNGFGLEPSRFQVAALRPSNKSTEIENLYFVGANAQPGAGIPGVLLSARITCEEVFKDLNMPSIIKPLALIHETGLTH